MTVVEGTFSLPGGYIAVFNTYVFSQAGVLDLTADWGSADDDIDVAIADGACTSDLLSLGQCTFAGLSESATDKPENLAIASNASTYTPLIGNFTAPTETITYRFLFTAGGTLSQSELRALRDAATAQLGNGPVLVRANGKLRR